MSDLREIVISRDYLETNYVSRQEYEKLKKELSQAHEENKEMRDEIDGNASEIMLESMHFEDGALEAYLKHPIFGLFAAAMVDMFDDNGAVNYLTGRVFSEKHGFMSLTIQKETGKTPHERMVQAENELAQANKRIEVLKKIAEQSLKTLETCASYGDVDHESISSYLVADLHRVNNIASEMADKIREALGE